MKKSLVYIFNPQKLLLILILLVSFQAIGQNRLSYGHLTYKNFPRKVYSGQQQNFGILESDEGTIIFANNNTVIEFNGTDWTKIKREEQLKNEGKKNDTTKYSEINPRSLYKTKSGRILVGAQEGFGYIDYNKKGQKFYVDLSKEVLSPEFKKSQIGKIWNIFGINDEYFFIGRKAIFVYREGQKVEIIKYPEGFRRDNSSLIQGRLFISLVMQNTGKDARVYNHLEYDPRTKKFSKFIPKAEDFHKLEAVKFIMPWKDENHYLIITQKAEAFTINARTNELFRLDMFDMGVEDVLISISNQEGLIIFSTEKHGVFIFNELGELIRQHNAESGLIDNYVNYTFIDNQFNLWCSTANGIGLLELSSPISYYSKADGITSKLWDIARLNNSIYLASNVISSLNLDEIRPTLKNLNFDQTTYGFANVHIDGKELIMVIGHNGIYSFDSGEKIMDEIPNLYAWKIIQSKKDSNRIYIGSENGVASAYWNGTKFDFETFYKNSGKIIHSLLEVDGEVYFGIKELGVVKLDTTKEKKENLIPGLKGDNLESYYFEEYQGTVFVGTSHGLYYMNEDKSKILPFNHLNLVQKDLYVHRIFNENDKRLWLVLFYNSGSDEKERPVFGYLQKNKEGVWKFVSAPFRYLNEDIVQGFVKDRDGNIWLGADGGTYVINTEQVDQLGGSFNINVTRFITGQDTSSVFANFNMFDGEIPEISYDKNNVRIEVSAQSYYGGAKNLFRYKLAGGQWTDWTDINWKEYQNLDEGTYTIQVQAKNYYGVESEVLELTFTILPPWYRTWWAYVLYVIVAIALIYGLIMLSLQRVKQQKKRLEAIVKERTAEIAKQNEVLAEQKDEIEHKNQEVLDSIKYAKRIQDSILPPKEKMDEMFTDYFVLFKPKDIVSGDFYWAEHIDNLSLFAAVDCTGHGVPGAMVSVVGNNGLNRSVKEFNLRTPGAILDQLREIVIEAFNAQNNMDVKDGMDMALCSIDYKNLKLEFAGANNPCIIIRNGEILETKADKQPIGQFIQKTPFTNHVIDLQKGDTIYTYSDGYVDQFGGEKGKKLKSKPFKNLLLEIQGLPMDEQRDKLDEMFESWRGSYEQIDDVCVFGVKI